MILLAITNLESFEVSRAEELHLRIRLIIAICYCIIHLICILKMPVVQTELRSVLVAERDGHVDGDVNMIEAERELLRKKGNNKDRKRSNGNIIKKSK